ncbi:hypothetical protein ACWCXH_11070 [Kitasatospora sp. NPDC001660]
MALRHTEAGQHRYGGRAEPVRVFRVRGPRLRPARGNERAAVQQGLGDGDAEPPGGVVEADACPAQRLGAVVGAESAGHGLGGGEGGQALHQFGDPAVRELVVAVARRAVARERRLYCWICPQPDAVRPVGPVCGRLEA